MQTPPRHPSRFVGRESELAAATGALAAPGALVTITGTPGVGKTRLAVEAAHRRGGRVGMVTLGPAVRDPWDALARVARELGADLSRVEDAGAAVDAIAGELARAEVELLLIDDADRLGAHLDPLIAAARAKPLLLTARRPTGATHERVVRLEPLGDEAVTLFLARVPASSLRPVDPEADREAIERALAVIGGLPLAVELATARLELMSVGALADRLADEPIGVLSSPDGASSSLEAAVWRSLEAVPELDREVLEVLCAFARGGTEVQVRAWLGRPVLDSLHRLIRTALVRVLDEPGGPRFSPYDTVALVVRDRATREGRGAALARGHARVVLASGAGRTVDDLLLVRERAAEEGTPEALRDELRAVELLRYPAPVSYGVHRYAGWIDEVLERHRVLGLPDRELLGIVLAASGAYEASGRRRDADAVWERAVAATEDMADAHAIIRIHTQRAGFLRQQADGPGMERHVRRALDVARAVGTAEALTMPLVLASELHRAFTGDDARALALAEEAVALATGDLHRSALAMRQLAHVNTWLGDPRGLAQAVRALELGIELDSGAPLDMDHVRIAEAAVAFGDLERAAEHLRQARKTAEAYGSAVFQALFDGLRALVELERGDLGAAEALLDASEAGVRASRLPESVGLHRMAVAAVAATRDRIDAAEEALREADALLGDRAGLDHVDRMAIAVGGLIELARARRAVAEGGTGALEIQRAKEALATIEPGARGHGRSGVRWLQRAIDAHDASALFVIAADGAWIRTPAGDEIRLESRPTLARLLARLARDQRDGRPWVSREDLVAAVWPDERMVAKAARNRVAVAVSTLRKMGIEVGHEDGSYRLLPGAAWVFARSI